MTKRHVDNYQPGKSIPSCQLSADLEDGSTKIKVVPFHYRIKLLGAKKPHNVFIIKPPPSHGRRGMAHHSSSSLPTKRSHAPPAIVGMFYIAAIIMFMQICVLYIMYVISIFR